MSAIEKLKQTTGAQLSTTQLALIHRESKLQSRIDNEQRAIEAIDTQLHKLKEKRESRVEKINSLCKEIDELELLAQKSILPEEIGVTS